MDVPGLSLFQEAESIKVNTNEGQRIEEEDAVQDRLRRNEELQNELQNAFDDLEDNDDEICHSVNCSDLEPIKKEQLNGRYKNQSHGDAVSISTNEKADLIKEVKYLKNVLSMKTEEINKIIAQNECERVENESTVEGLKTQLAISEAEKERAHMNRQQTHELFVESKQVLSEREERIVELNEKVKLLQARHIELIADLEQSKSMLNEMQQKCALIQRNTSVSSEKHIDLIVKQINDRHAANKDVMQLQINTLRNKLDERETELKRMIEQNNELHRSREAMLLNKSDNINQLTRQLENSHRQCQNMMTKNIIDTDLMQENLRLVQAVGQLESQIAKMQTKISELTLRLEYTTKDLNNSPVTTVCSTKVIEIENNESEQPSKNEGCDKCNVLQLKLEKIQSSYFSCLKDVRDWKAYVEKTNTKVIDLAEKLTFKAGNHHLVFDLKSKAQAFEEFMRNQSPAQIIPENNAENCVPEELLHENRPSLDRNRICTEMARAMATKLKDRETSFKEHLMNCEDRISNLMTETSDLKVLLRKRENDVLSLKRCILSERNEMIRILEEKNIILQKQYDTMQEYQTEIASLTKRENNLMEKNHCMELKYSEALKTLAEKCEAAKKMAASYKKYAADQEKHIEKESERIKIQYQRLMQPKN